MAAAKARGVKLDGTRAATITENARAKEEAARKSKGLRPILSAMAAQGAAMAAAGTTTAKEQALSPTQVRRHLERLGLA